MMKLEQRRILLQRLSKSRMGEALVEELEEEKRELQNIKNATSWEDTLGRQHAVDFINKLIYKLSNYNDLLEDDNNNNQYE